MREEEMSIRCHLCEFVGHSKPAFDEHMMTHYDHKCPFCDYTSRTEGRLERHIKDFHSEIPPESWAGSRTRTSNGDASNSNGAHSDSGSHSQMESGKPRKYRCKQCNFIAISKEDFWAHTKSHIKSEKQLKCPECPFVTEYKHHLEYHLRNHYGSKPFKCEKCNYSCVNKSMLNSHLKSHSKVYQYRCADCSYATKYCHSLKQHLRKYTHKPSIVLNPDGTPNPYPIIDVYGTRRGPRPKKNKPENENNLRRNTPVSSASLHGLIKEENKKNSKSISVRSPSPEQVGRSLPSPLTMMSMMTMVGHHAGSSSLKANPLGLFSTKSDQGEGKGLVGVTERGDESPRAESGASSPSSTRSSPDLHDERESSSGSPINYINGAGSGSSPMDYSGLFMPPKTSPLGFFSPESDDHQHSDNNNRVQSPTKAATIFSHLKQSPQLPPQGFVTGHHHGMTPELAASLPPFIPTSLGLLIPYAGLLNVPSLMNPFLPQLPPQSTSSPASVTGVKTTRTTQPSPFPASSPSSVTSSHQFPSSSSDALDLRVSTKPPRSFKPNNNFFLQERTSS